MPTHEAEQTNSEISGNQQASNSDSSPACSAATSALLGTMSGTAAAASNSATNATGPPGQATTERQPSGSQSGRSSLSSSSNGSSGGGDESRLLSSNADYDHIRNTTLMFFLDRLYIASKDGKEARNLHDLSCLFGTREFTKEMRQIVGASRNGLKKFLQCYPSLFTIDGDLVYLTQLKQDSMAPVRDYNKEAVEYFIQKLLQFGTSLVPIRNLFGYRSQASQEVRHVSGKSVREFKQFLGAHKDVFEILADEHVILKSILKELEARGETYSSLQQQCTNMVQPNEETVIDPYLNKQFAHFIENCMKNIKISDHGGDDDDDEQNDKDQQTQSSSSSKPKTTIDGQTTKTTPRVTIEYLHEKILNECNNQLFLKMVKTIEDLKMFLRMHPKIFKRFRCDQDRKDYVSLWTDDERKEMEANRVPSSHHTLLMNRQHSTLKRTETNESNLSDHFSSFGGGQPMSLPPQLNDNTNKQQRDAATINQEQEKQPISMINHHGSNNINENNNIISTKQTVPSKPSPSNGNAHRVIKDDKESSSNGHSSLRATAPPFVPSINHGQKQQQVPNKRLPLQASNSNRLPSGGTYQVRPSRGPPVLQRSQSNLSPAASVTSGSCVHHNQQQQQQHHQRAIKDPRAALRSYLIKATAVNSGCGLYSPSKLSNGAQHQHQHQNHNHNQPQSQQPLTRQSSNLTASGGDDLRTRTVNIVREASNIVTRIMTSTDAVAFDCKGYNLGFDGQITLVQFAFLPKISNSNSCATDTKENGGGSSSGSGSKQKPEVCIFDLITNPELAYCLKPLLESELVVKIVHDVKNKSNALFSQFGIMLNHVFDTQVANLVIQQQETGKPAYKSRYISMSKLCEIYGDESLTKYRNLIKSKTRHSSQQHGQTNNNNNNNSSTLSSSSQNNLTSRTATKDVNYWRTRPLTDGMVYESSMDVYCLVGGIYQNLKSKIIPEYKPLFEQLNLEGILARIKPEEIRSAKKERKIDLEVIDLKRKLYSDTTSSIVLSNREIRLLRHIDLSDEVRQKIQQCKKVAKKLERLDMKAAQQLQQQSMTSQVSSDAEVNGFGGASSSYGESMGCNNAPSVQTTPSLSSNSTANSHSNGHQSMQSINNDDQISTTIDTCQQGGGNPLESLTTTTTSDGLFNDKGELDETRMDNLMDGSMFDELKDKMIESSSLLESLVNDVENDDEVVSGEHLLHKHGSHDDCRCMCHKNNSIGVNAAAEQEDKSSSSLKLSLSSNEPNNSIDQEHQEVESKAVDMAIQCDLLN